MNNFKYIYKDKILTPARVITNSYSAVKSGGEGSPHRRRRLLNIWRKDNLKISVI